MKSQEDSAIDKFSWLGSGPGYGLWLIKNKTLSEIVKNQLKLNNKFKHFNVWTLDNKAKTP